MNPRLLILPLALCTAGPGLAQSGIVELVDTTETRYVAATATGVAVATTLEGRLLRSADFGATWTEGSLDTSKTARGVTVCDDGTVFAGTLSGLFKSTDDAMTWEQVGHPDAGFVEILCLPKSTDLLLDPRFSRSLYALRDNGTRYDSLFAKPDLGGTYALGRSATDEVIVSYAGCWEYQCGGLIRSTDGGWTFRLDSLWTPGWPAIAAAITETGATFVQNLDFAVRRSWGDTAWVGASSIPGFFDTFARIIPLHGDSLFAATHDGLFASPDAGLSWSKVSSPYADVRAYDAAMFDNGTILVATAEGVVRIRGAVPTAIEEEPLTDYESTATIEVYPDPFGSSMTVRTTGASCSGPVELFDIMGRRTAVLAGTMRPDEWIRYESPAALAAGPYILRALCDDGQVSRLVVHRP